MREESEYKRARVHHEQLNASVQVQARSYLIEHLEIVTTFQVIGGVICLQSSGRTSSQASFTVV